MAQFVTRYTSGGRKLRSTTIPSIVVRQRDVTRENVRSTSTPPESTDASPDTRVDDDVPALSPGESAEASSTAFDPRPVSRPIFAFAALVAMIGTCLTGLLLGESLSNFAFAGVQILPLAILSVLAYLGQNRLWARILAVLWVLTLLLGFAVASAALAVLAMIPLDTLAAPSADDGLRVLGVLGVTGFTLLVGLAGFIPVVRRLLKRTIPIDDQRFTHTIAFVTVVALTLLCLVPLLLVDAPPILALVRQSGALGLDIAAGSSANRLLLDQFYSLIWIIPVAFLAVGWGSARTTAAACKRLGLVRPTSHHMLLALTLTLGLVAVTTATDWLIGVVWSWLGWPRTDVETFEQLLAFAFSPIGAVVIGVTAGLGEELAIRGVLQPRLGIILSNLFFTSLHAFQYHWDGLLSVFLVGLVLALIRRRYNTTTSAIVHGGYDFRLVLATAVGLV